MKFSLLKKQVKEQIKQHYGFFFLLFLPMWIFNYIGTFNEMSSFVSHASLYVNGASKQTMYSPNLLSISSAIASGMLLSAMVHCINIFKEKDIDYKKGFLKGMNVFSNWRYFLGALLISILKSVYLIGWNLIGIFIIGNSFLFLSMNNTILFTITFTIGLIYIFICTIIKNLAYSQAQFIYRDAVDTVYPVSYNKAITESKKMMQGHKFELFKLYWSFILWYLLAILTLGLSSFLYSTMYIKMTLSNYYVNLSKASE